jgi:predicted RNase H-like nuclease
VNSSAAADRAVAGVDGCRAGWIAAISLPGEAVFAAVFPRFTALLEKLPSNAVIAVDMPIGLPDHCFHGGRGPENLVRPLLGQRQSSVFSIPSRQAVYAAVAVDETEESWREAHRAACAVSRATSTPPRGVAIQAFGLFSKIREIDALLRADFSLTERVIESHPEVGFWRLNGRRPLALPKKVKNRVYAPGMEERRKLLVAGGFDSGFVRQKPPRGAGEDDFFDALAVLTVARRHAAGEAERFPDPPLRDAHGLPIAIHV